MMTMWLAVWSAASFQIPVASRRWQPLGVVPLPYMTDLTTTANALVAPGKGVLASDESDDTMAQRFEALGVAADESTYRDYRNLVYTTPELNAYVSGVIVSPEALGGDECALLQNSGMLVGVRAEEKQIPLPGARDGETWSLGLDSLVDRANVFRERGARFATWRARFRISDRDGAPSALAVKENCWSMARCARTLQELGLVPVLEPAVLVDGDHTIERAAEIQERIYVEVFNALNENGVFLEGLIFKPSMTLPGYDCPERITAQLVAAYSVRTLERTVPSAVPGITFNSGGLSEEEASLCLDSMNRMERKGSWSLTFSFSRALQASAMATWRASTDNVQAAQAMLINRAKANAAANLGNYVGGSSPTLDDTVGLKGWSKVVAG